MKKENLLIKFDVLRYEPPVLILMKGVANVCVNKSMSKDPSVLIVTPGLTETLEFAKVTPSVFSQRLKIYFYFVRCFHLLLNQF